MLIGVATLPVAALGIGFHRHQTTGGELPGPAPLRPRADFFTKNAECEACHQEIAAEWRSSRHQAAFSNAEFQLAFSAEPTAFCRDCHAPESATFASAQADELGVGCITCHLRGDAVLAAPSDRSFLHAPHRLERSAAFAGSGGCAGCHEFSFGDDHRRSAPQMMQRTVSEHRASGVAERCADCHMPRGSHSFASTRDPEAHRRALSIRAERTSPTALALSITPQGVGHAYPTGDLFRRVVVHAEARGDDYQLRAEKRAFLARRFQDLPDAQGEPVRTEVEDTRIEAKPDGSATRVELDLGPAAKAARIVWRVSLERVQAQHDHREEHALVADRVELATGELE